MSDDGSIRKFNLEASYRKNTRHEFDRLSERIIGAAIKVHRKLGPGFLKSTYEEALKVELSKSQIEYEN
jgi:hypothetical protein